MAHKQARENFSLADVRIARWGFDDALRKRDEFLQFRQGQVARRDQVFTFQHKVRHAPFLVLNSGKKNTGS
jgi:hypothetical protein